MAAGNFYLDENGKVVQEDKNVQQTDGTSTTMKDLSGASVPSHVVDVFGILLDYRLVIVLVLVILLAMGLRGGKHE